MFVFPTISSLDAGFLNMFDVKFGFDVNFTRVFNSWGLKASVQVNIGKLISQHDISQRWAQPIGVQGSKQRKFVREGFLGVFRSIWRVFLEILPLQKSKEKRWKTLESSRQTWEKLRTSYFIMFFHSFSLFWPLCVGFPCKNVTTTNPLVAGGSASYYAVMCPGGCSQGDPKTKVLGTSFM